MCTCTAHMGVVDFAVVTGGLLEGWATSKAGSASMGRELMLFLGVEKENFRLVQVFHLLKVVPYTRLLH